MKGGFNNPPNPDISGSHTAEHGASMKGGFNNPPNERVQTNPRQPKSGFNEGGVQ